MEQFQECHEKAKKHLKIADHMIYMTYPLVRENKLLLVAIQNLFLSLSNAMTAILYYERLYKRVPVFSNSFEPKFEILRNHVQERYGIDKEYLLLIRDIKDIIVEHEKSPVEFSKDDKFVICSDSYQMKTITLQKMKDYLAKTKLFIQEIDYILNKNERANY